LPIAHCQLPIEQQNGKSTPLAKGGTILVSLRRSIGNGQLKIGNKNHERVG
jgi:hypothetical protein